MPPFSYIFPALLLTSFAQAAPAAKAPKEPERTACVATINSPDERELFEKNLPKDKFKLVELTDFGTKKAEGGRENDWFDKACAAGVQCDVLVVSGHFGGEFFGASGLRLTTDQLEKASCQRSCDGLLKAPKEVFLFGCNTLASKEKDHRTPEQYLRVLLEDNIPPAEAARIVEARYGAAGDSYLDRMRRVFQDVPRVYGFDSVGPAGKTARPFLERYFKGAGDYDTHLRALEAAYAADKVNGINAALAYLRTNEFLACTLKVTSFAQTSGLRANELGATVRDDICQLIDEKIPLRGRLEKVLSLLKGDDRARYLPVTAAFFKNNEGTIEGDTGLRDLLRASREDKALEKALDESLRGYAHSPSLALEMLSVKKRFGFLDQEGLADQAKEILAPEIKKTTAESGSVVCDAEGTYKLKVAVRAGDLDLAKAHGPKDLNVLSCAATDDERITSHLLKLTSTAKGNDLAMGLYLLSRAPGQNEARRKLAAANVGSKEPAVQATAKNLLFETTTDRAELLRLAQLYDGGDGYSFQARFKDERGRILPHDEAAAFALEKSEDPNFATAFAALVPDDSPHWQRYLEKMNTLGEQQRQNVIDELGYRDMKNPALAAWAMRRIMAGKSNDRMQPETALLRGNLGEAEVGELRAYLKTNSGGAGASFLRGFLLEQPGLSAEERAELKASPAQRYRCERKYSEEGSGWSGSCGNREVP
jgi:hypothetical protein